MISPCMRDMRVSKKKLISSRFKTDLLCMILFVQRLMNTAGLKMSSMGLKVAKLAKICDFHFWMVGWLTLGFLALFGRKMDG